MNSNPDLSNYLSERAQFPHDMAGGSGVVQTVAILP